MHRALLMLHFHSLHPVIAVCNTVTIRKVHQVFSGNIHSTCRTTCTLNHVTVASHTTEIRPFEFREISTFGEVWTLVIAFLDGNSKVGLRQAVVQVPYYGQQPSVFSSPQSGGGDRPRNVQLWAIVGSSNAPWLWPWPWIRSRSRQHTQYV